MTHITLDSLKGEAAATGKRPRPRTRSITRSRTRTTSLVILALLSAIGAASVAVDAAASTAAAPRSRSKFRSNSNSNVHHNSNSNYDSNLNLKLTSPSFYSPQNKVVITKSSEQLELEQRLHRLKGDADDSDDDDQQQQQQQQQQEFITSFYRRKREEHLKTTTAGRANAYDEFGNRRRRRDRREGSQTSLCSIHQSAAVRGGAVRSASASSSVSSTALFGGLGQDRGQDRDQDCRGQDRRDLHHRPRSKHASDGSKSARSPSHRQSSATARQDAQFQEDLDSTYDDNDGDDDDDNSGDYFLPSLSGDDNVNVNSGSTSASSTNTGGGDLGLLRVPCSIAINSNEDARSHPHHSHSHHHHLDHSHHRHHRVGNHGLGHSSSYSHDHHVKKTPIAAYVDTGAQVTVISASAARRAGILHLMDRRYAGRATGVGHCKVLGRIPARHVYFILGDGGDTAHGNADVKCHWDDPHGEDDYRDDGHNYSEESSTVQMEGPALTVLEGTVTQGVDVLLGLDVLQDWEAEIRMGPNKSITVRKRHGRTGSGGGCVATNGASADKLVIPFVNENYGDRNGFLSHSSRRRRHQHLSHRGGHDRHAPSRSAGLTHGDYGMSRRHDHSRHRHHRHDHHHGHHPSLSLEDEQQEQEEEDDDFSPTASDVESDLDMLEHSSTTCKTASATILGRASTTPTSSSESDLRRGSLDESLFEEDADNDDNVNYDDDDDYLQEDDDLVDEDDLGDLDMSGL